MLLSTIAKTEILQGYGYWAREPFYELDVVTAWLIGLEFQNLDQRDD